MISALFLSGCDTLMKDAIRDVHQERRAAKKGAEFISNDALYSFTVPDDNYYIEDDPDGVILIPRNFYVYYRGSYVIRTFLKTALPEENRTDLKRSFDWINEKVRIGKAKQKAEIIFTEDRDFRGEKALYLETFVPGILEEYKATYYDVKKCSYGYTNLIFYHKERLYWVHYSDPYSPEQTLRQSTGALPHKVKEETKERFKAFVDKVSIDPVITKKR